MIRAKCVLLNLALQNEFRYVADAIPDQIRVRNDEEEEMMLLIHYECKKYVCFITTCPYFVYK